LDVNDGNILVNKQQQKIHDTYTEQGHCNSAVKRKLHVLQNLKTIDTNAIIHKIFTARCYA